MRCPKCQREHTLRRAKSENSTLVACDVCKARFKILLNNDAQQNDADDAKSRRSSASRSNVKSARVDQAESADDAALAPVDDLALVEEPESESAPASSISAPPVLDRESFAPPRMRETPPTLEKRQERKQYDDRAPEKLVDGENENASPFAVALNLLKIFAAYFGQAVSPRYFQGIALYFLGTTLILGAVTYGFSNDEIFRIFIRFFALTFSLAAFILLLTFLANCFRVFDFPLNFTWKVLLLPAPILLAAFAVAPAHRASQPLPERKASAETPPDEAKASAETPLDEAKASAKTNVDEAEPNAAQR